MSKAQMTKTASDDKFPSDLQDDLEELDYYHNAGAVEVEVRKVDRVGDDEVVVVFRPPVGDRFRRRWQIPQSPDERTGLGLLLHTCGHNLGNAQNVIGERVPFTREDGEWEMAAEWPKEPPLARLSKHGEDALGVVAVGGALLLTPLTLGCLIFSEGLERDTEADLLLDIAIWVVGCAFWLFVMGIVGTLLSVPVLTTLRSVGIL